jgi:rhodanese-related sulfurtransferase
MKFLQNIFSKSTDIKQFLNEGALIIDVRTQQEFNSGHIKGSKKIPLDTLQMKVEEIKKLNKPIITVCQSGMRSYTAKSFLQGKGLKVMNGGSWSGLSKIVE